MSSLPLPSNTHLRIDFIVREVCTDGSVPDDDLRYIKFGDDVQKSHAKDFIDRCGLAVGLMFKPEGPYVISLAAPPPNKINTIKVVRSLVPTYGLKDAKDVVEAPPGTGFLVVRSYDDLRFVVKVLEESGAAVRTDAFRTEHMNARPGFPPMGEYVRRP